MTYNIITEKVGANPKDAAYRMAEHHVSISTATVPCKDDKTGEYYKDEMWFVEIPSLDKLMEIIEKMDDFDFNIIPTRHDPMDDWGFTLVLGDEEEYLYRYPILRLS